ncbi:MAG TPA: hypothetical protein VIM12_13965 [Noviherbaspirillum sp.]|uniref:hypothetical protein n=1 Tax=Noviherbaspirillum sp. TaxID=1926288 RepID=UPI002F947DA9
MDILFQIAAALLLVVVTIFAQVRIAAFANTRAKVALTRGLLALVGVGFGLTAGAYVVGRLPQVLAFLIGFGLVHTPAAIILFLKGRRGEGKS